MSNLFLTSIQNIDEMEKAIEQELERVFQKVESCHLILGKLIEQRSNLVYWKSTELMECGQRIKELEAQLNMLRELKRKR